MTGISKQTLVTFIVFTCEAYLHFLIGRNHGNEKFQFYLPSLEDTVKLTAIVMFFSMVSTYLTEKL
jgi:hypothetical protein